MNSALQEIVAARGDSERYWQTGSLRYDFINGLVWPLEGQIICHGGANPLALLSICC